MEPLITPQNITFTIGLLGIVFSIYFYFRNPQEALDKKQAIDQVSIDNKAAVLAKDLDSEKHATERRFSEMGTRMDKALELAMNHTHTVDVKVDTLMKDTNSWHLEISQQIIRLSTIIEERVPKK